VQENRLTRRKFIAGAALSGLASIVLADTVFVEPRNLVARRVDVRLKRLPEAFEGFRIAQISDIHYGPYMGAAGVERAVVLAQSFHPHLLALTGDFVSHPLGRPNGRAGARFVEPCADVLARCEVRKVAILGNHDHWNHAGMVEGGLKERGISVLRNAALALERGTDKLWIAGIDDAWVHAADLSLALRDIPANQATVLLSHEPDFADHASRYPVDLQLSGHSHGGQVRLPGVGALILPTLARKYPMGLNQAGNLQVYTNVGLGVINPPVRFLCPPEVTFLSLSKDRTVPG
jgi:predicted MPP superfamily phosphohydrolase